MPGKAPENYMVRGGCDVCLTVDSVTHIQIENPLNG